MPENNEQFSHEHHETRLVKLETKVEHLEGATLRQEQHLDDLKSDTMEIKTHLAKQNGSIPHMQEDVTQLKTMITQLSNQYHNEELNKIRIDTRTKIYLGIAALVGAALLGAAIRAWLPFVITALFGAIVLL